VHSLHAAWCLGVGPVVVTTVLLRLLDGLAAGQGLDVAPLMTAVLVRVLYNCCFEWHSKEMRGQLHVDVS
jgi:hypothetical protein